MSVPRVFISYSHDTAPHKQWILDLATRLRNAGIDAALDQWDLEPGDDLPHFMETQLDRADRVMMVCTENYVAKANSGSGGVGYEKMIVTSSLMKRIDDNKIIPIIRQKGTSSVPIFLKSKLYIDFSNDNEFEAVIDDLIRAIHGEPLFKKPELGSNPFTPAEHTPPQKNNDVKIDILKCYIMNYEDGLNSIHDSQVFDFIGLSRILFEIYVEELYQEGYLLKHSGSKKGITTKLKQFAIQQNWIN